MSQIRRRFERDADKSAVGYSGSLHFDRRLYSHDIAASIAHARMLGSRGIIPQSDADAIATALDEIRQEIEDGSFTFRPELEDIHMNIESRLIDKLGEVGGKLHTARSRNDQVATDLRLFTRQAVSDAVDGIRRVQQSLVSLAQANQDIVIPGYTHLQHAQPVLLAHHLLAYFEMLQRDGDRFRDCLRRVDVLPLGSGALAGVPYDIDREAVARQLGFDDVSRNSIDAVADRDFAVEYQSAAAICMMHLSRLAEETILWSSAEFGFVEVDDAYATGSSIMPQKRNPDMAELARGKTGRVYGSLLALLTALKGLPLAYNRDLQEDKEGLFDTVDTLLATLDVFAGMIATLHVDRTNAERAVRQGYLLATDFADYLVRKGEPFRSAHSTVARLVAYAVDQGKTLPELTLKEYRRFSKRFAMDVLGITVESSLAARDNTGGTAPRRVAEAIARARRMLTEDDEA